MTANPSGESIFGVFDRTAKQFVDREFLHVPLEACCSYSARAAMVGYGQARERVEIIAARLHAAGYRPGHRIGVALDNRPEFFLYVLASNSLGLSIVPLNAAMSAQELSFILAHSDVALAITHTAHAAHVFACLSASVPLHVVAPEESEFPQAILPPVAGAGEAALLYTSGTTGAPKGCILTNDYFLEIGRLYTRLGGYCRFDAAGDRLATPLPVTHMNALACSFMAMLMTGGCLIQLDRFHPSTWWRSLETSRATVFHYLGVMPALLLKAPAEATDRVAGTLRFGFGAGIDPRHHAAFETRFGVPLIEAWSMTETGAGAWITANHEPRHVGERCVGRPPPGLSYRLVDDAQREVAAGMVGELQVRRAGTDPRHGFFSGYYKDERATQAAWADDWFHTGDLLRIGEGGSFFFVDRSKNLIRRSGENIAAVEVESALQAHPSVLAAAVCPVSDDIRGEEVFAFVVLRSKTAASLETAVQLHSHCGQALSLFKSPGYIAFRSDLPQTASQKLARALIKALAAGTLAAGEGFDLRVLKRRAVLK